MHHLLGYRLTERQATRLGVGVLAAVAVFMALYPPVPPRQRPVAIRYKHTFSYPAHQQKNLIQVGSLDRG